MPTYEYECTQGCTFEVQQSIKDDAYTTCRKSFCPKKRGGVKLRRLISGGRFILKGSGWYSDGYSSSSGKPAADSGKSSSSEGSSSSGSSSSGSSSSGSSSPGGSSSGSSSSGGDGSSSGGGSSASAS